MGIKKILEENVVIWTLTMLATGFIAGIAAYEAILRITNQETIIRGTYVKKSNLVGHILRTEIVRELDHLIEAGTQARTSEDVIQAGVFLTRTRSFLIGLDLPKDANYQGVLMPRPVYDHQMIMMKNSWYGHEGITLSEQVARTLGLIQGLKSSYRARAGID